MPYGLQDDKLHAHRKFKHLSNAAVAVWTMTNSWCDDNLTDGFLTANEAAGRCAERGVEVEIAEELADAGLWERMPDGGYHVHDFLDYHKSRERVLAERAAARERMRGFRSKASQELEDSSEEVPAKFAPNITRSSSHPFSSTPVPGPLVSGTPETKESERKRARGNKTLAADDAFDAALVKSGCRMPEERRGPAWREWVASRERLKGLGETPETVQVLAGIARARWSEGMTISPRALANNHHNLRGPPGRADKVVGQSIDLAKHRGKETTANGHRRGNGGDSGEPAPKRISDLL